MFLKVMYTPTERLGDPDFVPDQGSYILGDVAEVRFTPVAIFNGNFDLKLLGRTAPDGIPPASEHVKIFSMRTHLKAEEGGVVKINLAQLIVTLKDSQVRFVYFDEEAYLCGDDGKTLEKFSARVSLKDLE